MPRFTSLASIDKHLDRLVRQWREHRDALARIDAVFAKYGIAPKQAHAAAHAPAAAAVAESAPAPRGGKRRRRRFGQNAEQFILGLLDGGKSLTTAQLNGYWKEAGRGGRADNPLTKMVKAKLLKRHDNPDGRGSRYTAA